MRRVRHTVSRPSEKVPTNFVRVMGHTPILSVEMVLLELGGELLLGQVPRGASGAQLSY